MLLGIRWLHHEEGLWRIDLTMESTDLYKNVNLHPRNIYARTYFRRNQLVLVPVPIVKIVIPGIESMLRQTSYLAPQHRFRLTYNNV